MHTQRNIAHVAKLSKTMTSNEERCLFCPTWSAKEELKLLENVDEYGYGNWTAVSPHLGRSPNECRDHYNRYYMYNAHPLLPVIPIRQAPPELQTPSPLSLAGNNDTSNSDEPVAAYYPGTEINGFMPHRGDFATEHDNNAERIIANINHEADDSKLVTALKLAAVRVYCSKLKTREYKRRIVRDYGLLDIKKQTALDKSRLTRNQLRLKWVARPFMRFMSPQSADKFLQSHFLEDELCQRIQKLQHYRENGITTFKGKVVRSDELTAVLKSAELYEKLLVQRRQQKAEQREVLKKKCSPQESLLYQVLNQGSMKMKKIVREPKLLDITYAAGVEKLEKEERELCSYCRFQPEAYLQFKRLLVLEHTKLGKLNLADARKLLKIDVNKTRKVYNLLVTKGLIAPSANNC